MSADGTSTPYTDPGLGHPGAITAGSDGGVWFVNRSANTIGRIQAGPVTPFVDVPPDHPFVTQIAAMADAGVIGGYADGTFRPTNPVSRQALASFVHRFHGSPSAGDTPHFADSPTHQLTRVRGQARITVDLHGSP